jgi:hypothetical protein
MITLDNLKHPNLDPIRVGFYPFVFWATSDFPLIHMAVKTFFGRIAFCTAYIADFVIAFQVKAIDIKRWQRC